MEEGRIEERGLAEEEEEVGSNQRPESCSREHCRKERRKEEGREGQVARGKKEQREDRRCNT